MFRRDIQALRGASLISVLFYHANTSRFGLGFLGVDLFFIISGFVIVPQIRSLFLSAELPLKNILDFYLRRILRLVPALLFTLLVFAPLVLVLGNVRDLVTSTRSAMSALFFVGNLFPLGTKVDYFNSGANPFIHAWSLGLEFQIYIFFPILVLMLIKRLSFYNILWIATLASFFLYVNLLFNPSLSNSNAATNIAFYFPLSRFWEFGIGGLIPQLSSMLLREKPRLKAKFKNVFLFIILSLLLIPVNFDARIVLSAIIFFTVVFLTFPNTETSKTFPLLVLTWFGNRSYSIYLVHLPLIYLAKFSPYLSDNRNPEIWVVTALILSVGFGAFSYSTIENRFRQSAGDSGSRQVNNKVISFFLLVLALLLAQVVFTQCLEKRNIVFRGSEVQKSTEWDENCKLVFRSDPCEYNTQATGGTILLLGDSHAAMYGKVFQSVAVEKNLRLYIWASPACQFFLPSLVRGRSGPLDQCEDNNEAIAKWVLKNKPNYLYLSVIDSRLNSLKYFKTSDTFALNILKSFVTLSRNSKSGTVILPTPKLGEYSLLEYFLNKGKFQMSEAYIADSLVWKRLSSSFSIATIGTAEVFCTNSVCRKVIGNRNIFSDTDHLTIDGASILRPEILKVLER